MGQGAQNVSFSYRLEGVNRTGRSFVYRPRKVPSFKARYGYLGSTAAEHGQLTSLKETIDRVSASQHVASAIGPKLLLSFRYEDRQGEAVIIDAALPASLARFQAEPCKLGAQQHGACRALGR